jgi:hypothetical protein
VRTAGADIAPPNTVEECLHCLGIELGAGVALELLHRMLMGLRFAMGAVGGHGVVGVHHG